MNRPMNRILASAALLVICPCAGCGDALMSASSSVPPNAQSVAPAQPEEAGKETVESVPREPVPTPTEAAYADDRIALVFPRSLGGLSFLGRKTYPQPGMGYSLRYENAGADDARMMKMDIYVYDNGRPGIPTGHADSVIVAELACAGAAIRLCEQKGWYLDVKKLAEGVYPEASRKDSVGFRSSTYQFRQSGSSGTTYLGPRVSETYVRGFKGHFIKVRITYPEPSSESSVATRDEVMKQLRALLAAACLENAR